MAVAVEPAGRVETYQLRLPVFEGPLDVLVRLIEQRRLAIADVSLVAVTDQFLAYMESGDVPPESLADFAAMAGRLLVLKSRSLLPAPPVVDDEPSADDLAAQVAAYRAMKAAAARLLEIEQTGLRSFAHQPPAGAPLPPVERLGPLAPSALGRALQRCLARHRPPAETYAPPAAITLGGMTRRLLARLCEHTRFSVLVGDRPSRTEYAVGFIALLSLLRQRVVEASQSGLFGEIEVRRVEPTARVADD
ncbi:MAG TPA: ScpA family protein [Thermomicrobiaceae bacterium]|nr:ScpA family protein [Thermomicrobiaceae bacterium]